VRSKITQIEYTYEVGIIFCWWKQVICWSCCQRAAGRGSKSVLWQFLSRKTMGWRFCCKTEGNVP